METQDLTNVTQDERTMAILAHVLQIVGWWIAPLIIYLIRRESRFVRFHALQALLLQVVHALVVFGVIVAFILFAILAAILSPAVDSPAAFPVLFFFLLPVIWLILFTSGVLVWVIAIVYAIKASRGEWAEYPVIGAWVRRTLSQS